MLRAAAVLLVLAALAPVARADGGVYGKPAIGVGAGVVKPVRTPDQRALLTFDAAAGTETLVVETTLQGEGTEFAWVLPLPAAPAIEASTTGLFPSLEILTGPDVCTDVPPWWMGIVWAGLAAAAVVRWRRGPYPGYAAAFLIATPFALMCVALGAPQMQGGDEGDLTFGKYASYGGGGAGVESGTVAVLSRETVGAYDTAVLTATDAGALRRWLDGNGFHAPQDVDPVVAQYVAEGWVFVASKVRAPAGGGVRRVHPLAFTFPAREAVYPMRLTGATNDTLGLDLWVAADREAAADGLDADVCLDLSEAGTRHEEISRRVGAAKCLTRLGGTLTGDAMHRDVRFDWVPADPRRPLLFTGGAVRSIGLGAASIVLAVGLIVLAVRSRRAARDGAPSGAGRTAVRIAAACGAAFVATWAALPALPEGGRVLSWSPDPVSDVVGEAPVFATASAARAWFAEHAAGVANRVTGEPIREEDSPGNYEIREADGTVRIVVHETWGPGRATNLSAFRRSRTRRSGDASMLRGWEDVTWGPQVAVAGTVRSPDGTPLADAEVWIAAARPGAGRPDGPDGPDDRETGVTVRTGADGRFEAHVPAGFVCDVGVAAPRRPRVLAEDVDLRVPPARPLDLVAPDGASISGRVLDTAGAPIPRAWVACDAPEPWGGRSHRADVNPDGTFEIAGIAPGTELEVVVHDHEWADACPHAPFRLVAGAPPRDLVVRRWRP